MLRRRALLALLVLLAAPAHAAQDVRTESADPADASGKVPYAALRVDGEPRDGSRGWRSAAGAEVAFEAAGDGHLVVNGTRLDLAAGDAATLSGFTGSWHATPRSGQGRGWLRLDGAADAVRVVGADGSVRELPAAPAPPPSDDTSSSSPDEDPALPNGTSGSTSNATSEPATNETSTNETSDPSHETAPPPANETSEPATDEPSPPANDTSEPSTNETTAPVSDEPPEPSTNETSPPPTNATSDAAANETAPPADDGVDTDGDGVADADDACPTLVDCDADGVGDADDACPTSADCDGDTLSDGADPCPTVADCDSDGLDDAADPCPTIADCDGDAAPDGADPCPLNADCDGDGLPDGEELRLGTLPLKADTDGGTLPDGAEVRLGLDPRSWTDDVRVTVEGVKNSYRPGEAAEVVVRAVRADGVPLSGATITGTRAWQLGPLRQSAALGSAVADENGAARFAWDAELPTGAATIHPAQATASFVAERWSAATSYRVSLL